MCGKEEKSMAGTQEGGLDAPTPMERTWFLVPPSVLRTTPQGAQGREVEIVLIAGVRGRKCMCVCVCAVEIA